MYRDRVSKSITQRHRKRIREMVQIYRNRKGNMAITGNVGSYDNLALPDKHDEQKHMVICRDFIYCHISYCFHRRPHYPTKWTLMNRRMTTCDKRRGCINKTTRCIKVNVDEKGDL